MMFHFKTVIHALVDDTWDLFVMCVRERHTRHESDSSKYRTHTLSHIELHVYLKKLHAVDRTEHTDTRKNETNQRPSFKFLPRFELSLSPRSASATAAAAVAASVVDNDWRRYVGRNRLGDTLTLCDTTLTLRVILY